MKTESIATLFAWLEARVDPFPDAEPGKPPTEFWPFIRHYAWPFRHLVLATAVLSMLVAALEVYLFARVGDIVDWVGTSAPGDFLATHGRELLWLAALVLLLLPALKFAHVLVVNCGLLGNFPMRNRWQGHRYLLRQSMQFFEDDFAGRVATKVMQSALAVREVVIKLCEILCYVAVYFGTAVILFAAADWRLALPMLAWLCGYFLTLRYFVPRLAKIAEEQAEARSMVTGRIVDSYTNIATVKMFAHAAQEDAFARESMTPFLDNVYRQMRVSALLDVTLNGLNALLIFSVTAVGIALWSWGAVSVGAIAFAVGLVLRLQGMAHWILWETAQMFENIGVVRDGIETIARDRSVVDAPDAAPLEVSDGEVRFEGVRFNYGLAASDGDAALVFSALDLVIHPGEKVGLVGRSGAGKSTVVKLLQRFYDIEDGRVAIDGQDIAKVTQESLRANIATVTQDTSLLHRSVLENILYGRPDATREQAIEAARQAHAHDFIIGLMDGQGRAGYEAHVGERGVKLSGGQRQRIAIARVLLKDAPVLILDEATSALDSEVEAAIAEQLYNLMAGKTVIAIAHRLSTIAAMDRLVVMERGAIIEQGTHAVLLREGGLYADLWARQSGGFLDAAAPTASAPSAHAAE